MANTHELSSSHIVEEIDESLRSRVAFADTASYGQFEPTLAIMTDNIEHGPSQMYIGIKERVAAKLGIATRKFIARDGEELSYQILSANENPAIHGIITQLPLVEPDRTDEVVSLIAPYKDVDGLGPRPHFDPATPLAIEALLRGHDIDYKYQRVALLGLGRLVGAPLKKLLKVNGAMNLKAFDENSSGWEVKDALTNSGVIISAVGKPGLLTPESMSMRKAPKVLIDAGTAEQGGKVVGDMSDSLREWAIGNRWQITPHKGGVGPLTVRMLLSNVVQAAENQSAIPEAVAA